MGDWKGGTVIIVHGEGRYAGKESKRTVSFYTDLTYDSIKVCGRIPLTTFSLYKVSARKMLL
jgi:hypothetical protein